VKMPPKKGKRTKEKVSGRRRAELEFADEHTDVVLMGMKGSRLGILKWRGQTTCRTGSGVQVVVNPEGKEPQTEGGWTDNQSPQ